MCVTVAFFHANEAAMRARQSTAAKILINLGREVADKTDFLWTLNGVYLRSWNTLLILPDSS